MARHAHGQNASFMGAMAPFMGNLRPSWGGGIAEGNRFGRSFLCEAVDDLEGMGAQGAGRKSLGVALEECNV